MSISEVCSAEGGRTKGPRPGALNSEGKGKRPLWMRNECGLVESTVRGGGPERTLFLVLEFRDCESNKQKLLVQIDT